MSLLYYAVAKGRKPGVFNKWTECQEQVKGFSGAVFKKFKTLSEAQSFMKQNQTQQESTIADCGTTSHKRPLNTLEVEEQQEIEKLLIEALKEENMLDEEPPAKKIKKASVSASMSSTMKKYGEHYFHEDSDGFVQVFTDGACENNGKKHAIAGLGVYFAENHPLNASEPVFGRATNNAGEIKASIKAIEEAQKCGIPRLNIFTDSQFLINSACKWMNSWKRNDWKLSSGKPVINKNIFLILDDLLTSGNVLVKWTYVPAHRGCHGNNQADKLAKEGARKRAFYNKPE